MTLKRILRFDNEAHLYAPYSTDIMLWEKRVSRTMISRPPYMSQRNTSSRWLYSKRTLGLRIV